MVGWSRWVLAISCVGGLAYAFYVYSVSPERVPVHYGANGMPDRWGSPLEVLVVHACVIGVGTVMFGALPELMRRGSVSLLNLPNKEYWLAPERRAAATTKFARWADVVGTSVNVLMIALLALLAPHQAEAAAPSSAPLLLMVGFLAFTLGSCVWLVRAYRLPASEPR